MKPSDRPNKRDWFEIQGLSISQEGCGMRISADAISFADWMKISPGSSVLDIGTGCGILALLAAKKGAGAVVAVEIDPAAAKTAEANFKQLQHSHAIQIIPDDALHYQAWSMEPFDHIISNPPWYKDSPNAAFTERQIARIQDRLEPKDLLMIAGHVLKPGGCLSLILPTREFESFRPHAELSGWWPSRISRLFTSAEKPATRVFSEWRKGVCETERQDIFRT